MKLLSGTDPTELPFAHVARLHNHEPQFFWQSSNSRNRNVIVLILTDEDQYALCKLMNVGDFKYVRSFM